MEIKKCSRCCVEKSVSEFYTNGKKGYHGRCKECDLIIKKVRYDAHPEKERTASREWARRHPEEHRAKYYRWEAAHKEQRIRYYREYNETHRKERRAFDRERHSKETPEFRRMWYERRIDRIREYSRINRDRLRVNEQRWRQNNPAKHLDSQNRRRARKCNAPRIEKIDRAAIIERDEWICYLCGIVCTPKNVTLDHVIPLFHNGSHTADNLRVACRSCNCHKGHKLREFLA